MGIENQFLVFFLSWRLRQVLLYLKCEISCVFRSLVSLPHYLQTVIKMLHDMTTEMISKGRGIGSYLVPEYVLNQEQLWCSG